MTKAKPQNKNCPVCGECLDINTFVPAELGEDGTPEEKEPVDIKPDDITFCFQCRTVLIINQALNIVVPDDDTLYEITHDEDFYHFINKIDQARKNQINLN
jgi:hypothetical protein